MANYTLSLVLLLGVIVYTLGAELPQKKEVEATSPAKKGGDLQSESSAFYGYHPGFYGGYGLYGGHGAYGGKESKENE